MLGEISPGIFCFLKKFKKRKGEKHEKESNSIAIQHCSDSFATKWLW
jgi:hypothetical protein